MFPGCGREYRNSEVTACDGSGRSASCPHPQTNRSKSVARARPRTLDSVRQPTTVFPRTGQASWGSGGSINFSSCCCRAESEFGSGQPSDRFQVIDFCFGCTDGRGRPAAGSFAPYGTVRNLRIRVPPSIIILLIIASATSYFSLTD